MQMFIYVQLPGCSISNSKQSDNTEYFFIAGTNATKESHLNNPLTHLSPIHYQ